MKSLSALRLLLLSCALLLAFGSENASAQTRSSNRNSFGSLQQNNFGQNGFGQNGSGLGDQGRFGNSGQSRFGQNQQGNSRSGRTGNQNRRQDYFVGSDAQQILRQLRNSRSQGRRPRARIDYTVEDLNDMRNSSRQSPIASKKPPVRVQLRTSFTLQQTSASELTTRASTQLGKALPATIAGTQLSFSDGIATLEGTVKSDYDRQLAARILSFQPGISQIDNRLTIESDLATPLLAPAQ